MLHSIYVVVGVNWEERKMTAPHMTIAIDPDLHKSGVAIFFGKELKELEAWEFPELMEAIDNFPNATFVVEAVDTDKTTYIRPGINQAAMRKIAQNVGMVKGTYHQLIKCIEAKGRKLIKVRPLKGAVKQKAKKDAKYFNKLFNWEGRTNEDKRDAAMIGRAYLG